MGYFLPACQGQRMTLRFACVKYIIPFVYSVEDCFLERLLAQEAARQAAHLAQHGSYTRPASSDITLHRSRATLPPEVAGMLAREPRRSEVPGAAGRHYHLLALERDGEPPWLVAEERAADRAADAR